MVRGPVQLRVPRGALSFVGNHVVLLPRAAASGRGDGGRVWLATSCERNNNAAGTGRLRLGQLVGDLQTCQKTVEILLRIVVMTDKVRSSS